MSTVRRPLPQISIAMATYNGQRFIAEQLASLSAQTLAPHELVIHDDGSSDDTAAIIQEFAERAPFSVIVRCHQDRIGPCANFVRSLADCTGDVVAFCDQDDVWHPAKLERLAGEFAAARDTTLIVHGATIVDASLRELPWVGPRIRRRRVIPAGHQAPLGPVRGGCTIAIRRSVVEFGQPRSRPGNPLNGGAPITHDDWANLVGGAFGRTLVIPDRLIQYRRHSFNTSPTHGETRLQRLNASIHRLNEAEHYKAIATAAAERAAFLDSLVPAARDGVGPVAEDGLRRSAESHARYSTAMHARGVAVEQARRSDRLASLLAAGSRGAYRPRTRGGLGPASALRDVTLTLLR